MGNTGLFSSCGGNLGCLSRCDRVLWAPLCCTKAVKPPLEVRGHLGLLSRHCRKKKGLMPQGRGILLVFSSCGGRLGIPLQVLWATQEASHVASGMSVSIRVRGGAGLLWIHCREISPQFTWKGVISRCFSRLQQKVWVLLSCNGVLREPTCLLEVGNPFEL